MNRGTIRPMISPQNPGSESTEMGTMKALHQALFQVERLKDTLSLREQKISTQQSEIERLSAHVQWLERQMKLDQTRRFGAASETSHSLQRELFNEAEVLVDQIGDSQDNETITVEAHQRKRRPRTPTIHDDLVKEIVTHELDQTERVCPHDQAILKAIGHDARRELKIIPEQVWAVEHRYLNYACMDAGKGR